MTNDSWPTEWLRGVLGVCVLCLLLDGPAYGYAVAAQIESAGLGTVKGGTLYPLLTRLEQAGWVEAEWRPGAGGPGRKYFALTAAGRLEARSQAQRWAQFVQITTALTDTARAVDTPDERVRAQEG